MSKDTSILSTIKLSKHFGGIHALDKLDIVIKKGQIHGLIGPNGAGKSTFFNVVTGLLTPTEGKIYFDSSIDITNLKAEVIANLGISRTFQEGKLVPGMTVLENVMCGMYSCTNIDMLGTFFRRPFTVSFQEKEIKERALKVLQLIGIAELAERWASELVWVEQQLVQIARALVEKPKLLLLDEPTSGMGDEESKRVEEIIRKIRDMRITVVVVSHDVKLVLNLSDWITALNFGEKISEGTPEQIQNDSKVLEAYLGEEKS